MQWRIHREPEHAGRECQVRQRVVEGVVDDQVRGRTRRLRHLSDVIIVALELPGIILQADPRAEHEGRCEGNFQQRLETEFHQVAVFEVADAAGGAAVQRLVGAAVEIELGTAEHAEAHDVAEPGSVVLRRGVPARQQEQGKNQET